MEKPISNFRFHQCILILTILPLSWLGMMVVHEFGHVMGAWWTGGTVSKVVLSPLTISRTALSHNPAPLLVVWSGPVLGVLIPLSAWLIGRQFKMPGAFLLRFFAGFCLIANGAYIAFGSFDNIGDAGDLLVHGASKWQLWTFGAITAPVGLLLWHQLGPHFGIGKAKKKVRPEAAYGCLILLVLLVGLELLYAAE